VAPNAVEGKKIAGKNIFPTSAWDLEFVLAKR
jgi:hypothetical protein